MRKVFLVSEIQFSLPESLVITSILETQSLLMKQLTLLTGLAAPSVIKIDIDSLSQIDTAGLQLLLSFIKQLKAKGYSHQWLGDSDILIKSAEELAMKSELAIDQHSWSAS